MKISGRTRVYGLIGDPVEHSLSPCIQNAAFQHLGLDCVYVVFKAKPETLGEAIKGMRGLGIHGLNVTMPYKIDVIPYLDDLDETAKTIGSVNTILNQNGRLVGYTTDGIGAVNALRYNGADPKDKKIVVLGAGGASRSVSFALARHASELVIANRTLERAERIAKELFDILGRDARVRTAGFDPLTIEKEIEDAGILVNATSVGMHPNETVTPIDSSFLRPDLVVFDLVYEPLETRLLRDAREIGSKTVNGLSMLVHQGAASFEIWTGTKAPVKIMIEEAVKRLKERSQKGRRDA